MSLARVMRGKHTTLDEVTLLDMMRELAIQQEYDYSSEEEDNCSSVEDDYRSKEEDNHGLCVDDYPFVG